MTIQPWVGSANQLCLAKSTPGIWSMSQFSTPKSASTIHTKICEETSWGMAQTKHHAASWCSRTQAETRRMSSATARPSRIEIATEDAVKRAVRRTTAQNVGSPSSVV